MKRGLIACGVTCLLFYCGDLQAQTVGEKIQSLQGVLDTLKDEMVPLCENLISVGRGIAGFAALWYIAYRVWRHIANAEPVDFFPLFRPFCLGFCILNFMLVLKTIDAILAPITEATGEMVDNSNAAIQVLLAKKEAAIRNTEAWQMYVGSTKEGNKEKWLRYTQGIGDNEPLPDEGMFGGIANDVKFSMAKASYNFRNSIKESMHAVLEVLFQAAALCINTLRTFQLVVLSIIGPLVFGLAVFDGFQNSLSAWLAKYINVYLWLPVCHIFGSIIGKIQEKMLALDLDQIANTGDTVFSAMDTGYLIFMLIAIVGYFTVPSVAGFIVNSGGNGMMQKVSSLAAGGAAMAGGAAGALAGGVASRAMQGVNNLADMGRHIKEGYSGERQGSGMMGGIGRMMGNNEKLAERISDTFGLEDKKKK